LIPLLKLTHKRKLIYVGSGKAALGRDAGDYDFPNPKENGCLNTAWPRSLTPKKMVFTSLVPPHSRSTFLVASASEQSISPHFRSDTPPVFQIARKQGVKSNLDDPLLPLNN
jgi:hypothetical protein